MRLYCNLCGKSVSNEVPRDTVIRAALVCPECIEKGEFSALRHQPQIELRDRLEIQAAHDRLTAIVMEQVPYPFPNIHITVLHSALDCFKLVFNARAGSTDAERMPLEIYLHTTQAIDLFSQLAVKLSEYMHQASAELLRLRGIDNVLLKERIRHGIDPL